MSIERFQPRLVALFDSSCYAASLSYLFDPISRESIVRMSKNILSGVENRAIDEDGFVRDPISYIHTICTMLYPPSMVEKMKIDSLEELPTNRDFAVQYAYGNTSHFVVANREGVVWDPYGNSKTVKYGKPISYRKFS